MNSVVLLNLAGALFAWVMMFCSPRSSGSFALLALVGLTAAIVAWTGPPAGGRPDAVTW